MPHVVERFELRVDGEGTELNYEGEIGADLWRLGRWWADVVARPWERTVEESLRSVKSEAERQAARARRGTPPAPR